jgi:hypothetical protein
MASRTKQPSQSEKEKFRAIAGDVPDADTGWIAVEDLVERCDAIGFWSQDFADEAAREAKKARVRKLIRTLKDGHGWPQWASVQIIDADGRKRRVYKQETLFDLEDYRKVVAYHATLGKHHQAMAAGYRKRAEGRFQKRLFE